MRARFNMVLGFVGVVGLGCGTAAADPAFHVHPWLALRAGAQHTSHALAALEAGDATSGTPDGTGPAGELEAGAFVLPHWSVGAFFGATTFHATLGYEYPQPTIGARYDASFRDLAAGVRVAWHRGRWRVGGAVGEVWVRERDRPLDAGGEAFGSAWHAWLVEGTVGVELVRAGRVGVELSVAIGGTPLAARDADHVRLYVPALVGVTWR